MLIFSQQFCPNSFIRDVFGFGLQSCCFDTFMFLFLSTLFLSVTQAHGGESSPPTDERRFEAEGRTDRQKEREQQNASAYRWRVGAECSPAAPRSPAALSTSPADVGPPRSRSCPSTTGNPVEDTAHLLKNTALLTRRRRSSGVTRARFSTRDCLLLATLQPSTLRR